MNLREEIKKITGSTGSEWDLTEAGQEKLVKLFKEWALEIISTHTEHEGGYCDTGEDMRWACRSDCVRLAENRINDSD